MILCIKTAMMKVTTETLSVTVSFLTKNKYILVLSQHNS